MSDPKNLKEALQTIEKLSAQNEQIKSEGAEKDVVIAELREQLSSTKQEVLAQKKIVKYNTSAEEHKDKSGDYEIAMNKFTLDGSSYTSEDVEKDQELVNKLVEMGAGVLVKVTQ